MRKVIQNIKYYVDKKIVYGDVYIEGEKFAAPFEIDDTVEVITCNGQWLFPSFVDLHVHLRTPGYEHKESLATGSLAAAHGGYTTVCCMPNTSPCLDNRETIEGLINRIEAEAIIEVKPFGAITKLSESKELTDHKSLIDAGCIGLSDDGKTTMNLDLMKKALEFSEKNNVLISTHSEDHLMECDQTKAAPRVVENSIVDRDVSLVGEVGGHLHVGHLSTIEGLEIVRKAKREGLKVTCEVTPHHLLLATENIDNINAKYKVNPPIRSQKDNQALLDGILDGTIDVIATDHAPHEMETKRGDYSQGAFGFSGIELAFSSLYTQLVKTEKLTLPKLVDMMSNAPRRLLGRKAITVTEGSEASFTIIDTEDSWIVSSETLLSKGKNTPFDGMELYGVTNMTMLKGRRVYCKEDV